MEPCINCARKHIGQALVLGNESLLGYKNHIWLAVGHLSEAEREILPISQDIAEKIRNERLNLMEGNFNFKNIFNFFDDINQIK